MDNKQLIRRFEAVELERRGSVEQIWDLIERFVLPFRGDFYQTLNSEHEVDWHRRDIYDSTAVFAVQSLAASLQSNLTNPSMSWFQLKFRDPELRDTDAAMEWLEQVSDKIFEALQDSNFNIEISEMYTDLVGFGTTVLTEENEDDLIWQGLNFQAIPIREVFFEEDFKKGVHILYRRLQMTAVQMVTKWGEEIPDHVKEWAKAADGATAKHTVVFAIYPREAKAKADTSKPLAAKERPYGFKYILKNSHTTLGAEGGYYEMPAFVGRWRKVAGSRWGHSPTTVALADILSCNQLIEATLEAMGKNVDPTILANESAIIGDLDLDRGSLNIVNDTEGIKVLEAGSRFDTSFIQLERLQESIRKAFYQDQLELKESPAMTATEVNVRREMIQRLIGPTLGRLQNDVLDPLVQRSFNIMFRAGQLPALPEGLTIGEMDIEYTGPLPRAQKMEEVQAIDRWSVGLANMAEVFPEALDLIDIDKAERLKAHLMGVPAIAMKSKDEIKEIREKREKQQQLIQAASAGQELGAGMEAMGKGAKEVGADPRQIMKAVAQGG